MTSIESAINVNRKAIINVILYCNGFIFDLYTRLSIKKTYKKIRAGIKKTVAKRIENGSVVVKSLIRTIPLITLNIKRAILNRYPIFRQY